MKEQPRIYADNRGSRNLRNEAQRRHREDHRRLLYVSNNLGPGFLEKVYENALALELRRRGALVQQQVPIKVEYRGKLVGEYFADHLVEDKVIVEVKAVRRLSSEHEAQLLDHLKATSVEVGILLNFGVKAEFVRRVFGNRRKRSPHRTGGVSPYTDPRSSA